MTTRLQKKRLKDLEGSPKGATLVKVTDINGNVRYRKQGSTRIVKLDRVVGTRPGSMPNYAFKYIEPGPVTSSKILNE